MTHTEFATVSAWCDRPNVDVLAGWEKGMKAAAAGHGRPVEGNTTL